MPHPKTADSDGSDNDGDGTTEHEAEYVKLQRQYRLLENDRKAYCQESQDQIKRQKAEIDSLEREQEEMTKDLRLIESRSNQTKNEKQKENLGELGKKKRDVEQEIENEKKKQQELDAQIREESKKSQEQRRSQSNSAGKDGPKNDINTQRKIRKLEDQLQLANNKFGKNLEANKDLRTEIDNLRVERQRFDNLYKKLEKERQDLQQETGEVIAQSTQAYDQRVEAHEKMILLNEKAEKDVQQHNAEMKELVRVIDHDRKLREFMNTKGKDRDEDNQLREWRERKEAMAAEKKKASQTDSVESYEAAFARIKEITQEEDIDLIVNRFIEVEDQNFALFNFVNDQNDNTEQLQEQIDQVKEQIRNFEKDGIDLEVERQNILKELEERQNMASKKTEEHDARYNELSKVLDQVKAGISSMFNKIGCERSSVDEMLGAQEGVTDQNLLQYLGIIEDRTNQLLLAKSYVLKEKDPEQYIRQHPSLLGEGPQQQHMPPSIVPPAIGDEFDSADDSSSEDEDHPFTKEELMTKALKSVRKREATMKKQYTHDELTDRDKPKRKEKHAKQGKQLVKT